MYMCAYGVGVGVEQKLDSDESAYITMGVLKSVNIAMQANSRKLCEHIWVHV